MQTQYVKEIQSIDQEKKESHISEEWERKHRLGCFPLMSDKGILDLGKRKIHSLSKHGSKRKKD